MEGLVEKRRRDIYLLLNRYFKSRKRNSMVPVLSPSIRNNISSEPKTDCTAVVTWETKQIRKKVGALADHVTSTGHSLKWDHFEVLAKGRSNPYCKIKETLLIKDLKPTLNEYVSSERLCLY